MNDDDKLFKNETKQKHRRNVKQEEGAGRAGPSKNRKFRANTGPARASWVW